ncbi:MAG: PaaI family thioesterase [Deltaproteobacteria bacterium]|nr:PaaI family thioesterase [Deltaproteobacteria bacterium]
MPAPPSSPVCAALALVGAARQCTRMSADSSLDARAALAASVRRLIHATVTVADDAALLNDAAARIDALAATLAAAAPDPPLSRYPGGGESPSDWMPFDAVMGRWNPLAAPLTIGAENGRAVGTVSFDTPYEGPPGCVHGAVIAASFDQVLNVANLMEGAAGPTARLELTFRAPTPLRRPLRFEGWVERREARKVHSRGRLLADGVVTVEAAGLFIQVDPERVMKLLG